MESDDKAFDTPMVGFESLDPGESDCIREFDFGTDFDRGVIGGYTSKGVENDID
jgi:hypothetical protein